MNKEIKELFNKYGVKDLKDKNGQSECYCCKNIKHKYSLTWTSFLYEYKEHYYCYECLLMILLQKENKYLEHNWNELKKYFKRQTIDLEKIREDISVDHYIERKIFLKEVLNKMQELEEGGNNDC